MAKITVTVDTDSEELDVSINGKSVPDVKGISIYRGMDYYGSSDKDISVNITCCNDDEESGVKTVTTLMAAHTNESKLLRAKGARLSNRFKDFIIINDFDKVKLDILEYFN